MSAYDGHVIPGGPAQTRTVGCLDITKLAVDEQMNNNCYLLHCRDTGDQVLIDAAAEPELLLKLIGDRGLTTVITTHQHWDHHRALADVVAATNAEVVAGAPDAAAITEQTGVPVTRAVVESDVIAVGNCSLSVIPIAGHTPGSICLLLEGPAQQSSPSRHLFTGDCLFPGGVGATFGDAEAFAQLLGDVESKIFAALPDDVHFYPGHGDDGWLGTERPALPAWRERGW